MQGSPPFRRKHALAFARERNEAAGDVGLRERGLAAAFAGEFQRRARPGKIEHAAVDQRVMDHHVGLGEPRHRMQRQQPGIAGAGAGEPDMAGLKRGQPRERAIEPAGHGAILAR